MSDTEQQLQPSQGDPGWLAWMMTRSPEFVAGVTIATEGAIRLIDRKRPDPFDQSMEREFPTIFRGTERFIEAMRRGEHLTEETTHEH